MGLSIIIGLERESSDKPAGLRTQMIVAGMAAFIVNIGTYLLLHYKAELSDKFIASDPFRLIESIIVGVSFLGAGTIFKSKEDSVVGLTTAASLLLSAMIGILVGLHLYILALGVSILSFLVLKILQWVGHKLES